QDDRQLLRLAGAGRVIGMAIGDERRQVWCAERTLGQPDSLAKCRIELLAQGASQRKRAERIGIEGAEPRVVSDAGRAPQLSNACGSGHRFLAGFECDRANVEHDALERSAESCGIGCQAEPTWRCDLQLEG